MGQVRASEFRDAAIVALGEEAVPVAALRERLGRPLVHRRSGHDELDRLLQRDTTFTEVSDGVVYVPEMLKGTAWTVWIDPDDGAEGFVRMHPALSALGWWLIGGDVELVDDTGCRLGALETDGWMLEDRDTDVVLGPDGWLDELVGRWVRVEVLDGALRWSALDVPSAPTSRQLAAVRVGFDRAVRHAAESRRDLGAARLPPELRFTTGAGPIHEALLADRPAFRDDPIPPLTDLYAAAGLVQRNSIIAEVGFDWEALHTWQTRNRLGISYGLDSSQADALAALGAAYLSWRTANGEAGSLDLPAATLDDGDVAAAGWSELGRVGATPDDLVAFASALRLADTSSIGAVWLRARQLDRSGDTAAAVDALEAAVDAGCRHGPALVDLAGLRADRGDAVGALRLLSQAGIDAPGAVDEDDPDDRDDAELLWDEIAGFATHRPRLTARRNDPCTCGSGRKYKACHLGRETHSLDDRAGWLYLKARRFLRERHPDHVDDVVGMIVDEIDQSRLFDALVESPFVPDVALHEDGVFAEFLAARDELLPDDEALLAAQWALTDRSVFEIVEVRDTGLELRDLASGERIRVTNTHPSDQTRPGVVLVGRPLPVGDTYRAFSGFMNVPNGHVDSMLAAVDTRDSDALTGALAALFVPPRLANTDGQDLVAHTVTWRVPDPVIVGEALVAAGLQAGGDDRWTLVRNSKNQDDTVIATVDLDGDVLTVETNSVERADELQGIVAAALPSAQLTDVDARPFEMPTDDELDDASGVGSVDMDDPAIRAVLAEHVAGFERRWLDESIPALGGRTPRQAAADPVGREELVRLLASFPVPTGDELGAMDPDRLRVALGL